MAKNNAKRTEDQELQEHRDDRHALLSEAHAIAVKQFGADVSPKIASQLFAYLGDDEDANNQLVADLAEAVVRAKQIYGEKGAAPEVAFSVFKDIYVADDE